MTTLALFRSFRSRSRFASIRFLFLLFIFPITYVFADNIIEQFDTRPPRKPTEVQVGFYLLNLVSVNEKDETFLADVYFRFTWQDDRLQYEGDQENPQIYSEWAAEEKLKIIWWPEPEFINTGLPEITNRILYIYPDGKAFYRIGLTANFRSHYDYRRFPFDVQNLQILVSPFIWSTDWVKFAKESGEVKRFQTQKTKFAEKQIRDITVEIENNKRGMKQEIFSNYIVNISLNRNPSYYLYQILIPCFIVLILSYCALFINLKDFSDRLIVGLTGILVFIATRFSINSDLPRITYITLLDEIFFLFYFCSVFTMIVSLVECVLADKAISKAIKLDRLARIIVPIIYLIVFIVFLLIWFN